MTLADLRARLAELPGDTLVVLARDAEGNDYSPLDDADFAMYRAETGYSGERYRIPEDPRPDDAVLAVFLWPTN
ncbi:hypothetical protein [Streptomyces botrytidirepellens]|uniref:Uncharacterized protein n=1 Tax=Streptomyces botrytidirepellens TaxID=2486417 RepID=A0A3M8V660_9ACTN|nr:hypothetical protein [Streptomyces botrytidirepellens]RNG12978.1 hypothetical protein EEJ42_31910 [Streptomyces botrytidirepellens]